MPQSVHTADGQVKASPGRVQWLLVSAAATGGAWQLDDGLASSTILLSGVVGANTMVMINLTDEQGDREGLIFKTGIFVDIQGSNVTITVGFN